MRLYLFGARNQSRRLHHENIVAASMGVAVESTASMMKWFGIWDMLHYGTMAITWDIKTYLIHIWDIINRCQWFIQKILFDTLTMTYGYNRPSGSQCKMTMVVPDIRPSRPSRPRTPACGTRQDDVVRRIQLHSLCNISSRGPRDEFPLKWPCAVKFHCQDVFALVKWRLWSQSLKEVMWTWREKWKDYLQNMTSSFLACFWSFLQIGHCHPTHSWWNLLKECGLKVWSEDFRPTPPLQFQSERSTPRTLGHPLSSQRDPLSQHCCCHPSYQQSNLPGSSLHRNRFPRLLHCRLRCCPFERSTAATLRCWVSLQRCPDVDQNILPKHSSFRALKSIGKTAGKRKH